MENSFSEAVPKLITEDICRVVRGRDIVMCDKYSNVVCIFLNSVSTSCRPIGQSNEKNKIGRKAILYIMG